MTSLAGESNRLSVDVVPTHYQLYIKTDLAEKTFSGTGEITIHLTKAVPSITLNVASPLELKSAILSHTALKTESLRPATEITVDEKRERAEIKFAGGELAAGEVKLGFRWEGKLEPSMMGYYPSTYPHKTIKDAVSTYALTQFESTAARRAFPCFDEPALKATYDISMISRSDTVSLSNMNVVSKKHLGPGGAFPRTELLNDAFFQSEVPIAKAQVKTEGKTEGVTAAPVKTEGKTEGATSVAAESFKDDWELVTFAQTPKVSTYLVAWANGEFEHIESSYTSPLTKKVIPMRVYATHDHIAQAGLALETKVRIMPLYETMFDIAYPLPKLDTLVASDFDAGAMENWGLITGRTSVYLYDPTSGIRAKKRVIGVQSHEVSHQWFGNIVTFHWWDNLWLNEAFATLIGEVIMIDLIEPSWKVQSSFISEHLAQAFNLDALRSSHPIEMDCPDEDTIQQIFDAVSYSKGGSVLRMLANMIGQETFLKGVSIYLKRHLYGNSRTADLWAGISEASGQDVAKIMLNWTTKIGFPVITVEETSEGLKLTQNRFLATGDPTPAEDETLWHVPLELLTVGPDGKTKIDHSAVLTTRDTVIPIPDIAKSTYKLNAKTCGVYRVKYSTERLAKLGDEAGKPNSSFELSDRMGLVQDAAALAFSGYSKTSGALTLINKMGGETENLVWDEISVATGRLAAAWWDQPQADQDAINKFRRSLFSPVAERLGFEYSDSDDVDMIELRTRAISTAAAAGDEAILAEYKRRFALLMEKNDESAIPANLRGSIFSQCVKYGGEAEYLKVLEIYRNPFTPAHKTSAMSALCETRQPELLQRTFAFMLSGEVKMQDLAYFFAGLSANPMSKRNLWLAFKGQYPEISKRFKGNFSIGSIVKLSFAGLSSYEDAQEVEDFFAQHDTSVFSQPLGQGLEAVRSKAAWLERDAKDVHDWLKANKFM